MNNDRLSTSLQESTLALLAFDNAKGNVAAGILTGDHFEEPYRQIATTLIDYHRRWKKAPGVSHFDDLFDRVLRGRNERGTQTTRNILIGIFEIGKTLNPDFVFNKLSELISRSTLTRVVVDAAKLISASGDAQPIDDIRQMIVKGLKPTVDLFDPGIRLGDKKRIMSILSTPVDALKTGIKELDKARLGPTRKEMHLFIAPTGFGKSWWLAWLTRQGIRHGRRPLVITLEMTGETYTLRMLQTLFAVARHSEPAIRTELTVEKDGRLKDLTVRKQYPRLSLDDFDKIERRLTEWGARLDRVVIKHFPTKSLTLSGLVAYLDLLEQTTPDHFVPDMILLDYPDLMKLPNNDDTRLALGETFAQLRGIAEERNLSLDVVTQGNRESAKATRVRGYHVAEDWSKIAVSDVVFTYSQNELERQWGTARLFVEKARNERDKFTVVITQSYDTGQFCVQSARMRDGYFDMLNELKLEE